MGILNLSPDSFSGDAVGGGPTAAVEAAVSLFEAGADVIDVGGESTRPGSRGVSTEVEAERVVPAIAAIATALPHVPLSVDTTKPEVAERAIAAGAHMVNDISGLANAQMREVVARRKVVASVMHMQGTPRTMQENPQYENVLKEVSLALRASLDAAVHAGIDRRNLMADPGFGFGKTTSHNLTLIAHARALRALQVPILMGLSRKRFLGEVAEIAVARERVVASAIAVAIPAFQGTVDMVRVHDVRATKEALAIADAVARAQ